MKKHYIFFAAAMAVAANISATQTNTYHLYNTLMESEELDAHTCKLAAQTFHYLSSDNDYEVKRNEILKKEFKDRCGYEIPAKPFCHDTCHYLKSTLISLSIGAATTAAIMMALMHQSPIVLKHIVRVINKGPAFQSLIDRGVWQEYVSNTNHIAPVRHDNFGPAGVKHRRLGSLAQ